MCAKYSEASLSMAVLKKVDGGWLLDGTRRNSAAARIYYMVGIKSNKGLISYISKWELELILRSQLSVMEYLCVPAPGKHFVLLMCPCLQPAPRPAHMLHPHLFLMILSKIASWFWWKFSILLKCSEIMHFTFCQSSDTYHLAEIQCCPCGWSHSGTELQGRHIFHEDCRIIDSQHTELSTCVWFHFTDETRRKVTYPN